MFSIALWKVFLWNGTMDNFLLFYRFRMYDGDSMEGLIPTPGNLGLQGMCLESPSG